MAEKRKPSNAAAVFKYLHDVGACNPEAAVSFATLTEKLSLPVEKLVGTIGSLAQGWAICAADASPNTRPPVWPPPLFISDDDDALDESREIIDLQINTLNGQVRRLMKAGDRCCDSAQIIFRKKYGNPPAAGADDDNEGED